MSRKRFVAILAKKLKTLQSESAPGGILKHAIQLGKRYWREGSHVLIRSMFDMLNVWRDLWIRLRVRILNFNSYVPRTLLLSIVYQQIRKL